MDASERKSPYKGPTFGLRLCAKAPATKWKVLDCAGGPCAAYSAVISSSIWILALQFADMDASERKSPYKGPTFGLRLCAKSPAAKWKVLDCAGGPCAARSEEL